MAGPSSSTATTMSTTTSSNGRSNGAGSTSFGSTTSSTSSSLATRPKAGATTTSTSNLESGGVLEVSILSVYDLPLAEPPIAVSLTCCGMTARTGPPVARHKDRNSFRFSATNSSSSGNLGPSESSGSLPSSPHGSNINDNDNQRHILRLVAPLRDLYKSKLQIRILYNNGSSKTLEAEYDVRQLKIHESKWLILNLAPPSASTTSTSTSAASPENFRDADDDSTPPPTIRLKFHLSGPYRPEIRAILTLCQMWFGMVDGLQGQAVQAYENMPREVAQPLSALSSNQLFATIKNNANYLILPLVPIVATLVVASPVLAGAAVVSLPFLMPVLVLLISLAVAVSATSALVYSSTKHGREHVGGTLAPFVDSLVSSRAGQGLIYDTGPRPTPVSVAKLVMPPPQDIWLRLVISLVIDLIGSSSYLLPVVGEGFDVAWAPIQTILIMALYDTTSPNLKYVSFIEEILPFTDIVPSATIGWACQVIPHLLSSQQQQRRQREQQPSTFPTGVMQ